jgi:DNA (cytosine-5)-methyltransferase 1
MEIEQKQKIYTKSKVDKYRVIDLFAGIGGIRIGFEQAFGENHKFVFASEINTFAQKTYLANFGEQPFGDTAC